MSPQPDQHIASKDGISEHEDGIDIDLGNAVGLTRSEVAQRRNQMRKILYIARESLTVVLEAPADRKPADHGSGTVDVDRRSRPRSVIANFCQHSALTEHH